MQNAMRELSQGDPEAAKQVWAGQAETCPLAQALSASGRGEGWAHLPGGWGQKPWNSLAVLGNLVIREVGREFLSSSSCR